MVLCMWGARPTRRYRRRTVPGDTCPQHYESLIETLEILSDRSAVAEIREAEQQMADGEVFGEEQVRAALADRRR